MSVLEHFKKKRKEAPFLIFVAFLISFSAARLYELLGVMGPSLKFGEGGRYTGHHLYYGIILLVVSTWIAINYKDRDLTHVTALLYGGGLGLFFDEIGLILTQFESYWDGITYTVIVAISLVFLNFIFFEDFWSSVGGQLRSFARERELKGGPLSLMGLVDFLDKIEDSLPETSKLGTRFIGVILIWVSILVIEFPEFVHYYIAGAFILTGLREIIVEILESKSKD